MDGLIERCFIDYNLLLLRGSYNINDYKEINRNEESKNQIQMDANSECYFS